jgi:hypothetical protein
MDIGRFGRIELMINRKVEGGKMINNKYTRMGAMFGLIICLAISMMVMASAEYLPQQQNTAFTLTITSNNATACNLSSIQYPDGTATIFNLPLTKDSQTFYKTIASGNYSQLGSICHDILCTDGVSIEPGSVCREVSPDGTTNTGANISIKIFAAISTLILMFFFLFLAGYNLKKDEEGIAIRLFFIGLGIVFLVGHVLITTSIMQSVFGDDSLTSSYSYVMRAFFIMLGGMIFFVLVKITVKEVQRLQKLKGLA